MPAVYTVQLFLRPDIPPGFSELFTAAPGFTTILRDIEVVFTDPSTTVDFHLQSGSLIVPFISVDSADGLHAQWGGRVAMNEGNKLYASIVGTAVAVTVTGYELRSPAVVTTLPSPSL